MKGNPLWSVQWKGQPWLDPVLAGAELTPVVSTVQLPYLRGKIKYSNQFF